MTPAKVGTRGLRLPVAESSGAHTVAIEHRFLMGRGVKLSLHGGGLESVRTRVETPYIFRREEATGGNDPPDTDHKKPP